jgi:hypothetical protein
MNAILYGRQLSIDFQFQLHLFIYCHYPAAAVSAPPENSICLTIEKAAQSFPIELVTVPLFAN